MPSFKYVMVWADANMPIEEKTLTYKQDEEVGCVTNFLQKHYSKSGELSAEQKQTLKTQIQGQLKKEMEITDEMLALMTNTETVDIVTLYPPRPAEDFVGIQLYCDDKGMVKQLPVNRRATEITAVCGKPTTVYGDAFFGRVQDDGRDLFERRDFTMADLRGDSPWIKTANAFNINVAQQGPSEASQELKTMMQNGQTPAAPKKVVSKQTAQKYGAKLQLWTDAKLKQYDDDEAFRAARDKKYTDRAGYVAFLDAKTKKQLLAETGTQ